MPRNKYCGPTNTRLTQYSQRKQYATTTLNNTRVCIYLKLFSKYLRAESSAVGARALWRESAENKASTYYIRYVYLIIQKVDTTPYAWSPSARGCRGRYTWTLKTLTQRCQTLKGLLVFKKIYIFNLFDVVVYIKVFSLVRY